jgi:hypothetical protein
MKIALIVLLAVHGAIHLLAAQTVSARLIFDASYELGR